MPDRETALKEQENAREWQAIAYGDHPATWAALAYYRERGWPVDANTFPERDRCENRIFAFKAGYAAALASPLSAPPQEPTMLVQLTADDVEWVVNDNAELGVKIGQQFFFCYKGHSLVYDTGAHDDGTPMMWRPVFKREFGECVRPVNYANPSRIGTVSLADSDQWKPLSAPIPPQEPTGASPQAETSEDEDDVPAVDSWSAPLRKPVVPKILSTDDFYALLRILEVLPVADPFLTDLQAKLSDEERRQHGNRASHLSGPEFVREIERIEALIQSRLPAPVSPVEPTPEPEPRMAFCDACVTAAHCNHHWRCLAECTPSDLKVKTNPCVWRITTGPLGTWVKPSCVEGSIPAPWGTERAKSCHLCGSPLRLVPSEETK